MPVATDKVCNSPFWSCNCRPRVYMAFATAFARCLKVHSLDNWSGIADQQQNTIPRLNRYARQLGTLGLPSNGWSPSTPSSKLLAPDWPRLDDRNAYLHVPCADGSARKIRAIWTTSEVQKLIRLRRYRLRSRDRCRRAIPESSASGDDPRRSTLARCDGHVERTDVKSDFLAGRVGLSCVSRVCLGRPAVIFVGYDGRRPWWMDG